MNLSPEHSSSAWAALTNYYKAGRSPLESQAYAEVYGGDIGQRSWNGPAELRQYGELLRLAPAQEVVDFGSGPGGCALFIAQIFRVNVRGFDINPGYVAAANEAANSLKLLGKASFSEIGIGAALPLQNGCADAILMNDVICHVDDRAALLSDFARVLKSAGRLLITDTLVTKGELSEEEMRKRSAGVPYYYTPWGRNEEIITQQGFKLLEVQDTGELFLRYTRAWIQQYESKRAEWLKEEDSESLDRLVERFKVQERAVAQGRLTRVLYLAEKP